MTTRILFRPGARLGLLLAAAMSGCLLVSPLGEFENASPSSGGAGGNSGGSSAGGTGGTGGSAGEGGEAGGGTGGSSGTAGAGGTGECSTNAECDSEITGPGRCRDAVCVPLKSSDCFLVAGNPNDDDAVFLGAFARYEDKDRPDEGLTVYPLRLAVDELNDPDDPAPGLNGAEVTLVICDNSNANAIARAMDHLVDEVGVPGVLATLKPADLVRAFERHPDVLYLSPVGRTSAVGALNEGLDPPLVWNLLGEPTDYTNVYVRLLSLVEDYVRQTNRYGDLDRVRVALVVDDADVDPANSELGASLLDALRFNGATTLANGDNFLLVRMTRDTSVAEAVQALWYFVPDIVISASGSEFTKTEGVLWMLENEWVSSPRPFYVLSPYNATDVGATRARILRLIDELGEQDANSRFVGVSVAGPENSDNQNFYAAALETRFPRALHPQNPPDPDTGNYYDAAYFLAYAAYAADLGEPLTGARMAAGLERLVDPMGANLDVGPRHRELVLDTLDRNETVALESTLGPPDFTDAHRNVNGSLFCFELVNGSPTLRKDVLVYAEDDEFRLNPVWTTFPCFPGFYDD